MQCICLVLPKLELHFGGTPNGLTQGHGGAHQPDECISIDGMLEALELTMLMLLECDKENIK